MPHLDTELAHLLITGGLDPRAAESLHEHLRSCKSCQAILAEERSLMAILKLDDQPTAEGGALDRMLDEVETLLPGRTADRWGRVKLYAALGTVAVSVAVTALSLRAAPDENAIVASQAGISTRLASQVMSELDALHTLREDPWIADEYDAVAALDRLVSDPEGAPR